MGSSCWTRKALLAVAVVELVLFCLQLSVEAWKSNQACGCSPRRFRRDLGAEEGSTVKVQVGGRNVTYVKHGDMLLDKGDLGTFNGYRGVDPKWKRWPHGNVKYYLSGFRSDVKQKISSALRDLSSATQGCVSFTEVNDLYSKDHKVEVKPTGGCFAIIGYAFHPGPWKTPPQSMTLGPDCWTPELIQHEFIHALGFYHEQDRPDRERTIRFNWNNIVSASCDLYKKCTSCKTFGPYDTESIMHYAGGVGACDYSKPAMIRLDGRKIEYNKKLTKGDIQKIRAHYECKGSGPSTVKQ